MRTFVSAVVFVMIAGAGLYWLAGFNNLGSQNGYGNHGNRSLPPSPLDAATRRPGLPTQMPRGPAEPAILSSETVRQDIRDVTGEGMIPAPKVGGETIARLPAVEPPPQPPKPVKPELWPRAEVVSAGMLKSGEREIIIADVEALGPDSVCRDSNGKDWPCGNFARAALQRLVRLRSVECDPASGNEKAEATRCRISGHDISLWLVERGWAVPSPAMRNDEALAKALEKAKSGKLGQWRTSAPGQG